MLSLAADVTSRFAVHVTQGRSMFFCSHGCYVVLLAFRLVNAPWVERNEQQASVMNGTRGYRVCSGKARRTLLVVL